MTRFNRVYDLAKEWDKLKGNKELAPRAAARRKEIELMNATKELERFYKVVESSSKTFSDYVKKGKERANAEEWMREHSERGLKALEKVEKKISS